MVVTKLFFCARKRDERARRFHEWYMGLQAFSAENLLCILQLLILLAFRYQVIKKGSRKPLHFGLQNQGFLPMREPIIYESLCD